ncbi:MAG: endonuclease III domain-containing protein [Deferribacteres bacterium]|nr:endonuclease III domain-containing protein [Deferribacteres bacterium]
MKEKLEEIYRRLFDYFGPQHWWPAESDFEVCVGAILTQNTSWSNVEKAVENLKRAGALSPDAIASMPQDELEKLIKPSGFYRQKAKRLKEFCRWLIDTGGLDALREMPLDVARNRLLEVKGIGRETADSILLYALEKPIFVVDAYTYRILLRHNIIDEDTDYDTMQELFMSAFSPDVELFKEYHALLVMAGKNFCKKKPLCDGCPLKGV